MACRALSRCWFLRPLMQFTPCILLIKAYFADYWSFWQARRRWRQKVLHVCGHAEFLFLVNASPFMEVVKLRSQCLSLMSCGCNLSTSLRTPRELVQFRKGREANPILLLAIHLRVPPV